MTRVHTDKVVGVFEDQDHAIQGLHRLQQAGFPEENIGLVARDWVKGEDPHDVKIQHDTGNAAISGAITGAGLGAAAGLLSAVLVPGVGPVLGGSLLLTALGGAALGAAAGTYLAPFIALEMDQETAEHYADHVESGRTVVVVRTHDRQEEAKNILLEEGAYDDRMGASPP